MYVSRTPTKATVIHEVTHAHQSEIQNKDPKKYEELHNRFISAADADNKSMGNKALWSKSMIDGRQGDEIWASSSGWLYGGSKGMISEASPKVVALLNEIY